MVFYWFQGKQKLINSLKFDQYCKRKLETIPNLFWKLSKTACISKIENREHRRFKIAGKKESYLFSLNSYVLRRNMSSLERKIRFRKY